MAIFRLTENHIKLLQKLNIGSAVVYDSIVVPKIDSKRPFGNSVIETDVADILEWEKENRTPIEQILAELPIALEIVLQRQTFEPGLYNMSDKAFRNYADWRNRYTKNLTEINRKIKDLSRELQQAEREKEKLLEKLGNEAKE